MARPSPEEGRAAEIGYNVLAYADDIVIMCDKSEISKKLELVERWCNLNDISLNKQKSAILHIRADHRTPIN